MSTKFYDKLTTENFAPTAIEERFRKCEDTIMEFLRTKCDFTGSKMNAGKCLQELDLDSYKALVELATEKLENLFIGFNGLVKAVKNLIGAELEYGVVDELPSEQDAARVVWSSNTLRLEVARNWTKPFRGKYIANVSGVHTKNQLRAFVVNVAHELVHILQHLFKRDDKQHGDDFYALGKSLFGFKKETFGTRRVLEEGDDGEIKAELDPEIALPYNFYFPLGEKPPQPSLFDGAGKFAFLLKRASELGYQ